MSVRLAAGESAVVVVVASVITALLYRVWELSASVPIAYEGDGLTGTVLIKGLVEHGWWTENPALGAPFGQNTVDFPVGGETLQILIIKAMTLFTSDPGVLINVYFLASFPLVALAAHWFFRYLRFSFAVALAFATLYSFLPFHFWHHQGHLFRSLYINAPMAGVLLLWVIQPVPHILRAGSAGFWSRLRRGPAWLAVCFCVVIATTDTMVLAFTLSLLALVGLIAAVRHRSPHRLGLAGLAIGVMSLTFLAVSAPTISYTLEHGRNPDAARRLTVEAAVYGLKLSDVLMPAKDHRIDALADQSQEIWDEGPIRSEGGQYIGLFGVVGLVYITYRLLVRGLPKEWRRREDLASAAGFVALLAVLLGTVYGLSLILSVLGFELIRTWNRIVIFIALFALVGAATLLERGLRRFGASQPVALLVAGAIIVIGVLDQSTGEKPEYRKIDAEWLSDREFVRGIEAAVPPGSEIFQLPIVRYPEVGRVERMPDYDLLKGYVHASTGLEWSYGAIKGRATADWQLSLLDDPPPELIPRLCAVGFDGLYVDRFGLPADGHELLSALEPVVGAPDVVSPNGRLIFFEMTDECAAITDELGSERLEALRTEVLGSAAGEYRAAESRGS